MAAALSNHAPGNALRRSRWTSAAGLVALLASAAPGQTGRPAGSESGLKPVEQGVADVSAFGLSFRKMQLDLRLPIGFDRVYELPANQTGAPRPPWASSASPYFARRSGALTAVFPRSDYVKTEDGVMVVVPVNTRFIIGNLSEPAPANEPHRPIPAYNAVASASNTMADRRADRTATRARGQADIDDNDVAATVPSREPGIMTHEDYRVRRVIGLLNAAADAADARSVPSAP